MKKRIVLFAALAAVVFGIGAVASGGSGGRVKVTAVLTAVKEVPKAKGVPRTAIGKFIGTLKGSTLTWTLTWSHLTGAATAAHIHQAANGVAGPVVVALCGKPACKSPLSGSSLLGKTVITAIEKGDTYVNIHTKKNPNGEIRGQLKAS
jgi:hypothetical protein